MYSTVASSPPRTHTDSGVGAGIDSYYEYCLKSYIVLGEETYLKRFEKVCSTTYEYTIHNAL